MKYLTLLFVLLVACGQAKEDKIQTLKDEAISVHDEVMPKMSELRYVRKKLEAQADSLMQTDSAQAQMIMKMANEIRAANQSMYTWMQNYKTDFEGTEEEMVKYYEQQKASIQQVKEDMLSTLAKGEEMVED